MPSISVFFLILLIIDIVYLCLERKYLKKVNAENVISEKENLKTD